MRKHILFSLFALLNLSVFATHNVSGDITYRWISGYNYEITVTTFTHVQSPADRCELMVHFGDGDSALAPRVNGSGNTNCIHEGVLLTSAIRYNVYKAMHSYAGDGNYYITMNDPNREANILNIPNSVNTVFGLKAYLKINSILGTPSSSPTWNHYVDIDTVYTNYWQSFDLSGVDIDGDSLSYEDIPCMGATGYVLPFHSNYFVTDPITGSLSWDMPTQIGYFSYAVLVKEWRYIANAYVLIGYTTREIFNVVNFSSEVNNLDSKTIQTNIYPNPSNTDLTITLNSEIKFENLKIEVLDISGRKIEVKYELKDQNIILSRQGLSQGSYIYKVFDKNVFLSTGKFEIFN